MARIPGISTPTSPYPAKLKSPPTFVEALAWIRDKRSKMNIVESPATTFAFARIEHELSGLDAIALQETLAQLWLNLITAKYLSSNITQNPQHVAEALTALSDTLKYANKFFFERAASLASPASTSSLKV